MNVDCELSLQALQHLLRLIKEAKSRKQKAVMVLRSSKGNKRFKVQNRAISGIRNRWLILQKIQRMSDTFFKKYFRMDRESFKILLDTIIQCISAYEFDEGD